MSEELKPCPHCGGEAAVYTEDNRLWAIRCMGQYVPSCWTESGLYHSRAEAIAAWNRRTPDWRELAQRLAAYIFDENRGVWHHHEGGVAVLDDCYASMENLAASCKQAGLLEE